MEPVLKAFAAFFFVPLLPLICIGWLVWFAADDFNANWATKVTYKPWGYQGAVGLAVILIVIGSLPLLPFYLSYKALWA